MDGNRRIEHKCTHETRPARVPRELEYGGVCDAEHLMVVDPRNGRKERRHGAEALVHGFRVFWIECWLTITGLCVGFAHVDLCQKRQAKRRENGHPDGTLEDIRQIDLQ